MFASQVAEAKKEDDDEDDDKKEDEDKEDKEEMKEGAYTNPGLEALAAKKRAEKQAAEKAKTK
jgi:hypothetical protein